MHGAGNKPGPNTNPSKKGTYTMKTNTKKIPLSQLQHSPENASRVDNYDPDALAELEASIMAHGLLENLVVVKLEGGCFDVVAGGRRLTALQELAGAGELDPAWPVPCLILPEGADAVEASLAENVVRVAMHPADQVEAFAKLAERGSSVVQIANRFGCPERLVKQRLALGGVAPEVMDAYRAGKLTLDEVGAFAITADWERQRKILETDGPLALSSWSIRRHLLGGKVSKSSSNARFVGMDAYRAAGGTITEDLFSQQDGEFLLDDEPLLLNLAMEKLEMEAAKVRGDWKWVEVMPECDWQELAKHSRPSRSPEPGKLTEEEEAEQEGLIARDAAFEEASAAQGDDLDDDDRLAEWDAIRERLLELQALPAERATYSEEQRQNAGVIFFVENGELSSTKGLVRKAGMKNVQRKDANTDAPRAETPTVAKAIGYSAALMDDLRSIRTSLVKSHLEDNYSAAFDLILFQLPDGCSKGALGTTLIRPRSTWGQTSRNCAPPSVRMIQSSTSGAPARPPWS